MTHRSTKTDIGALRRMATAFLLVGALGVSVPGAGRAVGIPLDVGDGTLSFFFSTAISGNTGASFVSVAAQDVNGVVRKQTVSDVFGAYSLDDLPVGSWELTTLKAGCFTPGPRTVVLTPTGLTGVNFIIGCGSIGGQVTRASGGGLPNATAILSASSPTTAVADFENVSRVTTTNSSGRFDSFFLPPDRYTVTPMKPPCRFTPLSRTFGVGSNPGAISANFSADCTPLPPPPATPPPNTPTLVLVHGYCAGDTWGVARDRGDFTGRVATFVDFGQNRTIARFAVLLGDFGAQFSSFGVVAHSMGGLAALQLLSWEWSGLDNATGGRKIQTVGAPWQGTPLADDFAEFFQILGVGCGGSPNLTMGGAAAFLRSIPPINLPKVFYRTTQVDDHDFSVDLCSIFTDPFLGDPDDGIIEEHPGGTLPGGVDLGVTSGWCHTEGMRHPPHTTDSVENRKFNAAAAR